MLSMFVSLSEWSVTIRMDRRRGILIALACDVRQNKNTFGDMPNQGGPWSGFK
jgi:hypothetical protein